MHEIVPGLEISQPLEKIIAHSCGIVQKVLLLDGFYGFVTDGCADGIPLAPGGRYSLLLLREYLFSTQCGSNPKCLGRGDDIRQNIEVLAGPPSSSSAEAALYLISDERNPVGSGSFSNFSNEVGIGDVVSTLTQHRLDDDVCNFLWTYQTDIWVKNLSQSADDSLPADGINLPTAVTGPGAAAIGKVDDSGDLWVPVPVDPPTSIQREGSQGSSMEGSIEAHPIAVVSSIVIADLDGVFDSLGSGIREKSYIEPEGFGDFHQLVMEMRRRGDVGELGVFPPSADEIRSCVAIWIDGSQFPTQSDQFRAIVSQGRASHVAGKIENNVTINIRTKRTNRGSRSIPDKVVEVSGMGGMPPVEFGPLLRVWPGQRRTDGWHDRVTVDCLRHDRRAS